MSGHTFCESCLQGCWVAAPSRPRAKHNRRTVPCPKCRQPHNFGGVKALGKNYDLMELIKGGGGAPE